MDADIKLDDSVVEVQGDRLTILAPDLELNNPGRRSGGISSDFRRALVHDTGDGLTINFGDAGDYPGGVRINGQVSIPGRLLLELHMPDEGWGDIKPGGVAGGLVNELVPVGGGAVVAGNALSLSDDAIIAELSKMDSPADLAKHIRLLHATVLLLMNRVRALEESK